MMLVLQLMSRRPKLCSWLPPAARNALVGPFFWSACVAYQLAFSGPQLWHSVWLGALSARGPLVGRMQDACAADRDILQEVRGGSVLETLLTRAAGTILHIWRIPQLGACSAASVMSGADA